MTEEQVNQVFAAFDQLTKAAGQPSILATVNQLTKTVPAEYRDMVLSQVKVDIAKALADSIAQTTSGINDVLNNPEMMEKIKEMGGIKDEKVT